MVYVPHKEVEFTRKKNLNKKFSSSFLQNKQACWLCDLSYSWVFFLGTLVRLSALPSTSGSGTSTLTAKDLSKKSSKKWRQSENLSMYPPKTPLRAILKSHMLFTKKIKDEFVTKNVDFTKKKIWLYSQYHYNTYVRKFMLKTK